MSEYIAGKRNLGLPAIRLSYGLVALLSIGLALASLGFVRPADCRQACDAPDGTPCPPGACRFREQRAGLPLPYVVDDPGGGSPTDGWARLGPEDPLLPLPFLADAVFYAAAIWLVRVVVMILRGKEKLLWRAAPPLAIVAAGMLAAWLAYRPYVGR